MKMNEFMARLMYIRRLIDDSFKLESTEGKNAQLDRAWKAEEEKLKAECGEDYRLISALSDGILYGNGFPAIIGPFYEVTAERLDRVLRELDVQKFAVTEIEAGKIIELEKLGWQWNEFVKIKGVFDTEPNTPALTFTRKS